MKTLQQLRLEFEQMAQFCHYSIKRLKNGEYMNNLTFSLWIGYWECAVKNNIISGNDANAEFMDK